MKKNFLLFALIFTGTSLFASPWESNLITGIMFNTQKTDIQKSGIEDVSSIGYGLQAGYLGIHESGFTLKADGSFGVAISDQVKFNPDSSNLGIYGNLAVGTGYSTQISEKLMLSFTFMFGVDIIEFEEDTDGISYKGDSDASVSQSLDLFNLNAGFDFLARFSMTPVIGFYAGVECRAFLNGDYDYRARYEYYDSGSYKTAKDSQAYGTLGAYRIQPTLGIIWTL